MGYPLPTHPKVYAFGIFHGYVAPSYDMTFSEHVEKLMLERNLDRESSQALVTEMLRDDFDRFFWNKFGFEDKGK